MKIFNYEITKIKPEPSIKKVILDKAEVNAESGVIQAKLELRQHTLLLEQIEVIPSEEEGKESESEREYRLTKEAVERDKRSINNWETQLRAINYERNY